MTERDIANEVLDGLREIREHRAGKRTLRTVRVEPRPLPELTPDAIRRIREGLDVSRAVFAHMVRVPLRTMEAPHSRPGASLTLCAGCASGPATPTCP